MSLKTITAGSMAEAVALVKREFGANATILHARTYKRGGFFGLGARSVVEVTAGHPRTPEAKPAPRSRAAHRPAAERPVEHPAAGDLIRRTYALAKAELAQQPPAVPTSASAPAVNPVPAGSSGPAAPTADQLAEEMRAVRRLVEKMMVQQRPKAPDLPEPLFKQYLELIEQELAEELAGEVMEQVRDSLRVEQLGDPQAIRQALTAALASHVPVDHEAGLLKPAADGRPRTIALIGPTGVGKTTTLAKLAATFKLKQAKTVGLITLDTYRIAAVDQLRTYANIIGVPLHVAMNEDELRSALNKMRGCDVVLIDTAGRSQRDDERLDQLKHFIEVADPHEVHLVLSCTCSEKVMLEAVERFSFIRTDRIIFTKLDEAVSFGVLFNVARQVNKRLSYVTTGQDVPHQIEPSRSERLAALVLGGGV